MDTGLTSFKNEDNLGRKSRRPVRLFIRMHDSEGRFSLTFMRQSDLTRNSAVELLWATSHKSVKPGHRSVENPEILPRKENLRTRRVFVTSVEIVSKLYRVSDRGSASDLCNLKPVRLGLDAIVRLFFLTSYLFPYSPILSKSSTFLFSKEPNSAFNLFNSLLTCVNSFLSFFFSR